MASVACRRKMMPELNAFFSSLIPYIPVGLLVLALLVGIGIIAVPEPVSAADRLERSVSVDGYERTYTVYLPKNASNKRDLRVMFVFHPATGTGDFMERTARLHEMPGSENFVVVYPDGIGRGWNAGRCCGASKERNIDEVAFFNAMMKDVNKLASVRPKAYLTGFSNGAFLVYYLMCKVGDRVAAAVPYGGFIAPEDMKGCRGGPVPLMHIHGEDDPNMFVDGGQTKYMGIMPPARTTVKWVAEKNGADTANPTYVDMPSLGTTCLRYSGATPASETSICIIPNLGHVWPGVKMRTNKFGPTRPDLQGSETVINFFLRY